VLAREPKGELAILKNAALLDDAVVRIAHAELRSKATEASVD